MALDNKDNYDHYVYTYIRHYAPYNKWGVYGNAMY